MQHGGYFIYKCPNCDNLLKKGSLLSGNTIGEKIFSDGKRIAPMLPEFPNLTKCKKCNSLFWLSKLEIIGFSYKYDNADEAEFLNMMIILWLLN